MSEEQKALEITGEQSFALAQGTSLFFDVKKFEHAWRVGKLLSMSSMVPEHFRGEQNIGNCVIALNYAERIGADPFMLMQNMYIVHGRPGIEGKLVIALINSSGLFTPLQFKREGKGKAGGMTAFATHKKTNQICEATVTWDMVVAEGWNLDKTMKSGGVQKSKWNTMPDVMFTYRSATFFARFYCPEVLLGMQTKEELYDIDMTRNEDGYFESIEHKTESKKEVLKEKLRGKKDSATLQTKSEDGTITTTETFLVVEDPVLEAEGPPPEVITCPYSEKEVETEFCINHCGDKTECKMYGQQPAA